MPEPIPGTKAATSEIAMSSGARTSRRSQPMRWGFTGKVSSLAYTVRSAMIAPQFRIAYLKECSSRRGVVRIGAPFAKRNTVHVSCRFKTRFVCPITSTTTSSAISSATPYGSR
jgi:hypothetical protein